MEKKCKIIYLNNFIYILSDDEIKEGDWCIYNNHIIKYNKPSNSHFYKKIIATTDTSVKVNKSVTAYAGERSRTFYGEESLPQPSQQFIEKYIESYNKGEVITDVLVEYEDYDWDLLVSGNNTIHQRPKVNPKDNTITIKKLKDSWNREEVIELLKLAWKESDSQYDKDDWVFNGEDEINITTYFEKDINKWIKENL